MTDPSDRLRAALSTLVRGDAAPELDTLGFQRARIISQSLGGRVSLQIVHRGEQDGPEAPDTLPVAVWMGVPGCSADHAPGQEVVLGFSRADASDPVAFLAAPKGQPGHVPIRVCYEAMGEIRWFRESTGIGHFGAETVPVALAPAVVTLITAMSTFCGSVSAAVGDPATQLAAIKAAANVLATAISNLNANVQATKLRAI